MISGPIPESGSTTLETVRSRCNTWSSKESKWFMLFGLTLVVYCAFNWRILRDFFYRKGSAQNSTKEQWSWLNTLDLWTVGIAVAIILLTGNFLEVRIKDFRQLWPGCFSWQTMPETKTQTTRNEDCPDLSYESRPDFYKTKEQFASDTFSTYRPNHIFNQHNRRQYTNTTDQLKKNSEDITLKPDFSSHNNFYEHDCNQFLRHLNIANRDDSPPRSYFSVQNYIGRVGYRTTWHENDTTIHYVGHATTSEEESLKEDKYHIFKNSSLDRASDTVKLLADSGPKDALEKQDHVDFTKHVSTQTDKVHAPRSKMTKTSSTGVMTAAATSDSSVGTHGQPCKLVCHCGTSTSGPFMKKLRRARRLLVEAKESARKSQLARVAEWRKILDRHKFKMDNLERLLDKKDVMIGSTSYRVTIVHSEIKNATLSLRSIRERLNTQCKLNAALMDVIESKSENPSYSAGLTEQGSGLKREQRGP